LGLRDTRSVFERKILGPTKEANGIWRIKTKCWIN